MGESDAKPSELSELVCEILSIKDGALVRVVLKNSMYLSSREDYQKAQFFELNNKSDYNKPPNVFVTEINGRYMGRPYFVGEGYFNGGSDKDTIQINPFNYINSDLGHGIRRYGCVRVPLTAINSIEEIGSARNIKFEREPAVRPIATPR